MARLLAIRAAALGFVMAAGLAQAAPVMEGLRPLARTSLDTARRMIEQNRKLPQEAAFEIGLLQALLGDLDAGIATIRLTEDRTGPGGPRWTALYDAGRLVAGAAGSETVRVAAERQRGADRAALLFGLAAAEFAQGRTLEGMLTVVAASTEYPALGAAALLDQAATAVGPAPVDLVGPALDLARQIPPDQHDADGASVQAAMLGRLMRVHIDAGNDAAALAACEAITDVGARQAPLLALCRAQAAAGRWQQALDTAAKLSTEAADAETGVSLQVSGLVEIATRQQATGDSAAAKTTAQRAVEAAGQCADPNTKTRSVVHAAEAMAIAGENGRASNLIAEALVIQATGSHAQRTAVLLAAGRVLALAGEPDLATQYFAAGRTVATLARDEVSLALTVTRPASVGAVADANAGLALVKGDPDRSRAFRILLARTLAASGRRSDGVTAARDMPRETNEDRAALVEALCEIVRVSQADSNPELLREAIDAAKDPLDLPSLRQISDTAVACDAGHVAVDVYAAALSGAAKQNQPESALGLPHLLANIRQAVSDTLKAGRSAADLSRAAEQAALTTRDATGRVAALDSLALALAEGGDLVNSARLLGSATTVLPQVAPEELRVQATAEHGAVADAAGQPELAREAFVAAEELLDSLETVPPTALLTLSECETQALQSGAQRFVVRGIMAVRNLDKEGSTDLLRLHRVSLCSGMYADAQAILGRIYRPEEQLVALLDMARAIVGSPLRPLRESAFFTLPAGFDLPRG